MKTALVRVRLCGGAGSATFWEMLDEARGRPADLDWAGPDAEDGQEAWISPASLVWVSRRAGFDGPDDKGRVPLQESARIEVDEQALCVRGTGKVSEKEIASVLPYGLRLRGKRPPKKTAGEGRWAFALERYQLVLFGS